jgi:hypothetical protein
MSHFVECVGGKSGFAGFKREIATRETLCLRAFQLATFSAWRKRHCWLSRGAGAGQGPAAAAPTEAGA